MISYMALPICFSFQWFWILYLKSCRSRTKCPDLTTPTPCKSHLCYSRLQLTSSSALRLHTADMLAQCYFWPPQSQSSKTLSTRLRRDSCDFCRTVRFNIFLLAILQFHFLTFQSMAVLIVSFCKPSYNDGIRKATSCY